MESTHRPLSWLHRWDRRWSAAPPAWQVVQPKSQSHARQPPVRIQHQGGGQLDPGSAPNQGRMEAGCPSTERGGCRLKRRPRKVCASTWASETFRSLPEPIDREKRRTWNRTALIRPFKHSIYSSPLQSSQAWIQVAQPGFQHNWFPHCTNTYPRTSLCHHLPGT